MNVYSKKNDANYLLLLWQKFHTVFVTLSKRKKKITRRCLVHEDKDQKRVFQLVKFCQREGYCGSVICNAFVFTNGVKRVLTDTEVEETAYYQLKFSIEAEASNNSFCRVGSGTKNERVSGNCLMIWSTISEQRSVVQSEW